MLFLIFLNTEPFRASRHCSWSHSTSSFHVWSLSLAGNFQLYWDKGDKAVSWCEERSVNKTVSYQMLMSNTQSCASLSPPFSSGHIPGCKCKYINIKPYFDQHSDVCLAAFFVMSKISSSCSQAGLQGSLHALSGEGSLALLWLEWNPLFPLQHKWCLLQRWKQPSPVLGPSLPRDAPSYLPQGYPGWAGRLP